MPDAFRQFHLDCEGKQSIKQLCLSIKMAVSEAAVRFLSLRCSSNPNQSSGRRIHDSLPQLLG